MLAITGGAPDGIMDGAMLDRTNETRQWGVSDPLENGRGTEIGGKRRGSLTPQLPPCTVATRTLTVTRGGAERRRLRAAKSQASNDMDESNRSCYSLNTPIDSNEGCASRGGNTARKSAFPLFFRR